MERRLITVVAADMVEYSRLMATDEEATLTRLRAVRVDVIDPEIGSAGGRIVKTMGDGLLVEFPSPVAAMRAVIAVQRTMPSHEANMPEDRRIVFRVGVNLGDVIIDGDDIMGDGVNIAARLEGLAEPGGICISNSVYEQVKGKVDCGFTDLGPQQVKNIPDPVNAFAVMLDDIASAPSLPRGKPMLAALAAVLMIAVVIGGYVALGSSTDVLADLPAVIQSPKVGTLIVLPFQDYSQDKSLDYFADGMTEDLITDLSRWKEFRVIARSTSMTYKDKPTDVRKVAEETGARYVLEGSVRRIGDQMRVTAQLIDGASGSHLWAERFEDADSDILALQDSVIKKIVQTPVGNHGVVREDEYARTWAKAATDLEEYDYFLRGHALFYRYTPEDMARAIGVWTEGREKFPESGLLKIKLGWGYYLNGLLGFTENRVPLQEILELALEGMGDSRLPPTVHRFGLWLVAALQSELGHRKETIVAVETAVQSYPFDGEGLTNMAASLTKVGEYDTARILMDRARDLDVPFNAPTNADQGKLDYAQNECVRAIPQLEKFLVDPINLLFLAGCYAEAGRGGEARALLQIAKDDFSVASPTDFPTAFQNMLGVTERLTTQLAEVGWPE